MIDIRRVFSHVEDFHHEFGPAAAVPLRRGAIGAVLTNPFAGRYVEDIVPMMDALQAWMKLPTKRSRSRFPFR